MALSVQTLFNFSETPFKIKLLAGKQGLSKTVSWVYYTEDPSTIEFIRGGEIAITTGLNYERLLQNQNLPLDSSVDSEEKENILFSFLKEFIDSFLNHGASGLIINTGKYVRYIPQTIIDYCNEKSFPLFTIPWEIHTIDLLQDFGNMISSDNQNTHTIEKLFEKAIFEKDFFDVNLLENTNFHNCKKYSIILLEYDESLFHNDMEQINHYLRYTFNPKLSVKQDSYCSFIHNHNILYIINGENILFRDELLRIMQNDKYFENQRIGISDYSFSAENLRQLYNHAKLALEIDDTSGNVKSYEKLGIYKILAEVKNKIVLENMYHQILGKLDIFDDDKKEDYLKTLNLYLKYSGNIQEVSYHNSIHRNTVLYRMNRIEEILNIDLSDGETRCLLHVALYIKKLLFQSPQI